MRRGALLAIAIAIAACGPSARPTPAGPPAHGGGSGGARQVFPLAVGAAWTYKGTLSWVDDDQKEHTQDVTWTMRITERIDRGTLVVWLVKGFPGDLPWSDGQAQPGDWFIAQAANRYYLGRATPQLVQTFRVAKDPAGALTDDDLLFQTPLQVGASTCHGDDVRYCWVAEDAGGGKVSLVYRTNPDDTEIEITPGVGISAYAYHHHGTLAEVDVRLVSSPP